MCSIGLAPNKLLAKIASDLDKPDGFFVLTPERMLDAVGDRPAALIPGVGPKTAERLRQAGRADRGRARGRRPGRARPRRGTAARRRAAGARERGRRAHRPDRARAEVRERRDHLRRRTSPTPSVLHETLDRLAARVCEGLGRSGYRGRTVTVKVRLRPFRTFTRSQTLEAPTRDAARRRPARPRAARAGWSSMLRCAWSASGCRGSSATPSRRKAACSRRRRRWVRVRACQAIPYRAGKWFARSRATRRRAAAVGVCRRRGPDRHAPSLRGRRPEGAPARRRAGTQVQGPAVEPDVAREERAAPAGRRDGPLAAQQGPRRGGIPDRNARPRKRRR